MIFKIMGDLRIPCESSSFILIQIILFDLLQYTYTFCAHLKKLINHDVRYERLEPQIIGSNRNQCE